MCSDGRPDPGNRMDLCQPETRGSANNRSM